MRDPGRIDPIVKKLGALWHQMPDMRLGQLVMNLAQSAAPKADVFNVEDNKMIEAMDGWLKKSPGPHTE